MRTQYPARPGRRVIVVTDLNSLRGTSQGTVELRLYWGGPSPVFDLGEPYLWRWLYQIGGQPPGGPDQLSGPGHADRGVAGAGPAQGRSAGLGGASSAAAGRRGPGRPVTCIARSPPAPWPRRPSRASRWAAATRCWAHGVISRPTQDVDLFTEQEHGVQDAWAVLRPLP